MFVRKHLISANHSNEEFMGSISMRYDIILFMCDSGTPLKGHRKLR